MQVCVHGIRFLNACFFMCSALKHPYKPDALMDLLTSTELARTYEGG